MHLRYFRVFVLLCLSNLISYSDSNSLHHKSHHRHRPHHARYEDRWAGDEIDPVEHYGGQRSKHGHRHHPNRHLDVISEEMSRDDQFPSFHEKRWGGAPPMNRANPPPPNPEPRQQFSSQGIQGDIPKQVGKQFAKFESSNSKASSAKNASTSSASASKTVKASGIPGPGGKLQTLESTFANKSASASSNMNQSKSQNKTLVAISPQGGLTRSSSQSSSSSSGSKSSSSSSSSSSSKIQVGRKGGKVENKTTKKPGGTVPKGRLVPAVTTTSAPKKVGDLKAKKGKTVPKGRLVPQG